MNVVRRLNVCVDQVWRRRVQEDFWRYFEQQQMTDLVLICDDGDIRAHRVMLASFSDVLDAAFRSEDEDASFVRLVDLSINDVSIFLKCLYFNQSLSEMKLEDIEAVMKVASVLTTAFSNSFVVKNEKIEERKSEETVAGIKEDCEKDPSLVHLTHTDLAFSSSPITEEKSCLAMTQEERIAKSADNLERICRFCSQSVLAHRVSLKVKHEKNNTMHLKCQYVCCTCGMVTSSPSNFIQHHLAELSRVESSGNIPELWTFPCSICTHTIIDHRLICCHCGEEFSSHGVLTIHLKTVQTSNLVECDYCDLAVASSQLNKHMIANHSNIVPARPGPLEETQTNVNMPEPEKFLVPCNDCPMFVRAIKKHKMRHYKDAHHEYYKELLKYNNEVWKSAPSSQYSFCDLCNKSIRKCNMKDHKLHTHGVDMNNKPIVRKIKVDNTCDICGHVSKYSKDLKKHKKSVHEKILDHACKFCGKKFSNRGNLNQHEVIHTGITPFQCHVCGRQCRRKSELEKHITTHVSLGVTNLTKLEPLSKLEPLDSKDAATLALGADVLVQGEGGMLTRITQAQLAGAVPVPGGAQLQPLPLILAQGVEGGDIMRQADVLKTLTGQPSYILS